MLYKEQVATKQCYLAMVSTKKAMKKVQFVDEEMVMLEDIDKLSEDKVVELVQYELDEPSSDCFFLVGSNMKEQERTELIECLKSKCRDLRVDTV
ncbi:hypothetical protein Acr_00g0057360 [Actinidia rufa]|uniref:Uncharacterized protein n=1 Tax=Actinidia rufa TaxID=165716 RepID=A0A7J0DMS3_9ERIC|nr:hypothetical protein Acr_00g0057360 [Actinidia rufa]